MAPNTFDRIIAAHERMLAAPGDQGEVARHTLAILSGALAAQTCVGDSIDHGRVANLCDDAVSRGIERAQEGADQ